MKSNMLHDSELFLKNRVFWGLATISKGEAPTLFFSNTEFSER